MLTLVERGDSARSFRVDTVKAKDLPAIIRTNVAPDMIIMTDEAGQCVTLRRDFVAHGVVRHSKGEYGRGPIHTNTVEGFYSVFKRGMKDIYQHCGLRMRSPREFIALSANQAACLV